VSVKPFIKGGQSGENQNSYESLIRDIKVNIDKFKIIVPEADINKLDQTVLYQMFIDDELITVKDWFLKKGIDNSQKFLTSEIPINNLSTGIHTLKINRVRWRSRKNNFILIEDWVNIPFKKNDSFEIR